MDNKKLASALNATGKECFVSYLKYFSDFQLTNEDIASIIQRERGYTFNSCRSRTSKARSILKNNRLEDALQIIIEADRTDFQCRTKAQELLKNIKSQKTKTVIRKNTSDTSVSSTKEYKNNETAPSSFRPNLNTRTITKTFNIKFPD
ncbi:MAG: hypothetical protein JRJ37_01455, partial [Deltaproteobacteria bacterium]|nr:hypothetical protein [Deltaproteobacteria bacterium]